MAFKKGDPRPEGAGRKPGSKNKITIDLKDALDESLVKLGGVEYLIKLGIENPQSYASLLGKRMPKELSVDASVSLVVATGVPNADQAPDA